MNIITEDHCICQEP